MSLLLTLLERPPRVALEVDLTLLPERVTPLLEEPDDERVVVAELVDLVEELPLTERVELLLPADRVAEPLLVLPERVELLELLPLLERVELEPLEERVELLLPELRVALLLPELRRLSCEEALPLLERVEELLPLLERVELELPEERVALLLPELRRLSCEEALPLLERVEELLPELLRLACEEEDRVADDPEEERLACATASGAAIIVMAMTRAAREVNIFLIAFRFSKSLI